MKMRREGYSEIWAETNKYDTNPFYSSLINSSL